jgi:hypothetical protein
MQCMLELTLSHHEVSQTLPVSNPPQTKKNKKQKHQKTSKKHILGKTTGSLHSPCINSAFQSAFAPHIPCSTRANPTLLGCTVRASAARQYTPLFRAVQTDPWHLKTDRRTKMHWSYSNRYMMYSKQPGGMRAGVRIPTRPRWLYTD